jgi:hypothetical protein
LTQGPIPRPPLLLSRRQRHDGARLSPTHAGNKGQAVSILCLDGAYHSQPLRASQRPAHSGGRYRRVVLDRLRAFFASRAEVSDAVAPLGLDAATQRAVLDRSAKLAERWTKLASRELRERVRSLVQQIQIGEAQMLVWLHRTAIVSSVMPGAPPKPTERMPAVEPFVLSITASRRRAGKGVRLVIGNGAASSAGEAALDRRDGQAPRHASLSPRLSRLQTVGGNALKKPARCLPEWCSSPNAKCSARRRHECAGTAQAAVLRRSD